MHFHVGFSPPILFLLPPSCSAQHVVKKCGGFHLNISSKNIILQSGLFVALYVCEQQSRIYVWVMSRILKVRKKDDCCKFCMREPLYYTCLYHMWHIPKPAAGSAGSKPQTQVHRPGEHHSYRAQSTTSSSAASGMTVLCSWCQVQWCCGDSCCCNRTSRSGGIFQLLITKSSMCW